MPRHATVTLEQEVTEEKNFPKGNAAEDNIASRRLSAS